MLNIQVRDHKYASNEEYYIHVVFKILASIPHEKFKIPKDAIGNSLYEERIIIAIINQHSMYNSILIRIIFVAKTNLCILGNCMEILIIY